MQTVAETPLFIKQAAELFSDDERKELIDFLAANPQVGDEIPGTGGVRKMRSEPKARVSVAAQESSTTGTAMTRRSMRCWHMARTKRST
jgi:hypothetical protein